MANYELEPTQVRLVLSCLDEQRDTVLRKTDNLRKMKGSIDDELHENFMTIQQNELYLIHHTYLALTEK